MQTLKYNNVQLSIFDFDKAQNSRAEFITALDKALGLESSPTVRVMLERCLTRTELLSLDQRHFIKDVALRYVDRGSLTDKQHSYLENLHRRARAQS